MIYVDKDNTVRFLRAQKRKTASTGTKVIASGGTDLD